MSSISDDGDEAALGGLGSCLLVGDTSNVSFDTSISTGVDVVGIGNSISVGLVAIHPNLRWMFHHVVDLVVEVVTAIVPVELLEP